MPEKNYILILSDGTELQFAAGSTKEHLIGVYTSFEEADAVRVLLTDENLKGASFDGEILDNVLRYDLAVNSYKDGENLEVHFRNILKSDIEIMQEQITELQEALAEIAG